MEILSNCTRLSFQYSFINGYLSNIAKGSSICPRPRKKEDNDSQNFVLGTPPRQKVSRYCCGVSMSSETGMMTDHIAVTFPWSDAFEGWRIESRDLNSSATPRIGLEDELTCHIFTSQSALHFADMKRTHGLYEPTVPSHRHTSITPVLLSDPLNQIIAISSLLRRVPDCISLAIPKTSSIGVDYSIATRYETAHTSAEHEEYEGAYSAGSVPSNFS